MPPTICLPIVPILYLTFLAIKILFLSKGHNSGRGDNSDENNYGPASFSAKFQDPRMHNSKDVGGIKSVTDGQTDRKTYSFQLFQNCRHKK